VRQRGNPHPGRYHLDQQQGIIHTFELRIDTCRLQKVTPDVQSTALYRVNQQRFAGQIVWRYARFRRQRMIRSQHQPHLKIKHR